MCQWHSWEGKTDCELKAHLLNHYGKIDRCIQEADVLIALRKDKLEFGQGGSDPYMQIARCYDLVVEVLTDHSTKDINASNSRSSMFPNLSYWYLASFTHPCICWLDSAQGPCCPYVVGSLMVTNQLSNHLASLFSCSPITPRTCQGEVARLLGALVRGISSLRRWGHDGNPFRHLPLTQYCLQARDWTF